MWLQIGCARQKIQDYDRVKRAFGSEQVNEAVQQVKAQEAAERELQKAKKRSLNWVAR